MSPIVNVVGSKDNYQRWKPDNLRHYKTMAELCAVVERDRSRIFQLERAGVIPKPIMVKVGRHRVRLYSPEEVAAIKRHFQDPERQKHNGGRRKR